MHLYSIFNLHSLIYLDQGFAFINYMLYSIHKSLNKNKNSFKNIIFITYFLKNVGHISNT